VREPVSPGKAASAPVDVAGAGEGAGVGRPSPIRTRAIPKPTGRRTTSELPTITHRDQHETAVWGGPTASASCRLDRSMTAATSYQSTSPSPTARSRSPSPRAVQAFPGMHQASAEMGEPDRRPLGLPRSRVDQCPMFGCIAVTPP
jgi:hypothetical protein